MTCHCSTWPPAHQVLRSMFSMPMHPRGIRAFDTPIHTNPSYGLVRSSISLPSGSTPPPRWTSLASRLTSSSGVYSRDIPPVETYTAIETSNLTKMGERAFRKFAKVLTAYLQRFGSSILSAWLLSWRNRRSVSRSNSRGRDDAR